MSGPPVISADTLSRLLDYGDLIEALREQFRLGCEAPLRHRHAVEVPGEAEASLLLMPAWQVGKVIGVKVVTVVPGNAKRDLPAVTASFLLLDGISGRPLGLLEGDELTARRTACASALAADYLAPGDARTMLMVGTGALAPHLVRAHATVRPIGRVLVWGRSREKAATLADDLGEDGFDAGAAGELEQAVPEADVISCATLASEPLIEGAWLRPGQHVDLVGAFRPDMRETDDAVMARARVYVDTRDGAMSEGGDIVQAMAAGTLSADDIQGDLFDLTRGKVAGRGDPDEITVFKSVGTALEDLAAANLAVERLDA